MKWLSILLGIFIIILVVMTAIISPLESINYSRAVIKSTVIIAKWSFEKTMILFNEIKLSFKNEPKKNNATSI